MPPSGIIDAVNVFCPPIVCDPAFVTKSVVSGSDNTPVFDISPAPLIDMPAPAEKKPRMSVADASMLSALTVIPVPPTTLNVLLVVISPPPVRPAPAVNVTPL